MTKVIIEMSMSLDGFIAGPGDGPELPLGGRNGMRLHDWLFSGSEPYEDAPFFRPEDRNREIWDAIVRSTGALLTGRRTYDLAGGWNGSHPIPGLPVVILTHAPSADVPRGASSFTFCTDVAEAVSAARAKANGKDVIVHGASTTQQLLAAGLVDELRLHVTPMLLGDGRPLFAPGADAVRLEAIETIATPQAVHMHYSVVYGPEA